MTELSKHKILVVDDIPTNITILTEILMSDYNMVCATNGVDAIKIAAASNPDLILLDIMMPEMDGYDVCRKLKSQESTKDIPVIFLTAKNEETDEVKGLETGAVDYISKPFSATILKHKVRIHIELKRHRDHLEEMVRERTIEISKSHHKLHQEITERIQLQKTLIEQRAYFLQLFENSPHAIMILDPEGKVHEVNKGFKELFGYGLDNFKGTYAHLIVPDELVKENEVFHNNILAGKTISRETYRSNSKGELIPVKFLGYPAVVKDHIEGIFIIYEDISYRKKYEAQMLHQSFHDPLTGIPNRALLIERLNRSLQRSKRRQDYRFAVIMIDLDNFKTVNDSLGQLAGDKFLSKFAVKIRNCIRATDTIARMGGDEFAVLLEEFSSPREVFKIVRRIVGIGETDLIVENNSVRVGSSIGLVINTRDYSSAEDILRDADIAMYQVKESGKLKFRTFKQNMRKKAIESIKMKSELEEAIENNQLILYYQPIYGEGGNVLRGFEALIRWAHPIKGIVGPHQFIPLAEETDLIIPIGHMIIKKACEQLRVWHRIDDQLSMNVNVSTRQFADGDLINCIFEALKENQMIPGRIKLEITESLLIKNAKQIATKLSQLKDRGVGVVLDDFGTGYSSLSYIKDFQIEGIKIDRSFINDIDQDNGSAEIVKTILALCRNLNLGVVAEGVERKTQLDILNQLNCEKIQGFYFSKPLTPMDAENLIYSYINKSQEKIG